VHPATTPPGRASAALSTEHVQPPANRTCVQMRVSQRPAASARAYARMVRCASRQVTFPWSTKRNVRVLAFAPKLAV